MSERNDLDWKKWSLLLSLMLSNPPRQCLVKLLPELAQSAVARIHHKTTDFALLRASLFATSPYLIFSLVTVNTFRSPARRRAVLNHGDEPSHWVSPHSEVLG
jgi:hypothetical protein